MPSFDSLTKSLDQGIRGVRAIIIDQANSRTALTHTHVDSIDSPTFEQSRLDFE